MRVLPAIILGLLLFATGERSGLGLDGAPGVTLRTISSFELTDQYGNAHSVRFPLPKIMVVVVADRKGAAEVDGWVQPLVVRFGKSVEIAGIATMSNVPSFLRPMVRKRFAEVRRYPVMLDWDGKVSQSFGPRTDHTTVYLLERNGRVAWQGSGDATADRVRLLLNAIAAALTEQ